jgi:hypothetical protein
MATFATLFKDKLLDLLEERKYDFCQSEKQEYSKGQYQIKFDGYIQSGKEAIIIEIEFRRADPINNLVKTMHWICHANEKKKVRMIQLYDNNYYSLQRNRYKRDFTIFLAKRCNLLHKKLYSFRYLPIDIDVNQRAFRKNDKKEAESLAIKVYKRILKII